MEEKNKDIEQEEIMRQAFPNEKGFSYSNVKEMKRWYLFYYERVIKGQQVVGLLENDNFADFARGITPRDWPEPLRISDHTPKN